MKHLRSTLAALCALCIVLTAGPTLGGGLKVSLGGFYNSSNMLDLPQQFDGKVEGFIGDASFPDARYLVKIRARTKPYPDGSLFQLREAWAKAFLGPFDLSFGNQVVNWGTTDMFSPQDLLNASDYSLPFDSEKVPTAMLRVTAHLGALSFDFVGEPWFTMPILPNQRWLRPAMNVPSGVTVVGTNTTTNAPALAWSNISFGGRFKASIDVLQGLDFGLMYFQGFRSVPSQKIGVRPAGTPGQVVAEMALGFPRYQTIGADLTLAFPEGLLMRLEGGYRTYDGAAWFADNTNTGGLQAVGALEYTFLGIKAIGEYVVEWGNWGGLISGRESLSHTGLLLLSRDFGSRWNAKIGGGYRSDGSGFLVPQLQYQFADGVSAQFKTYFFLGDDGTTYGQFRENQYGELDLTVNF